jgi:hypothetical protein
MRKAFLLTCSLIFCSVVLYAQQDTTLNAYVGKYVFEPGSPAPEATVALEGGTLTISSTIGSASLSKIEGDVFAIVEFNGTAEFKRNDQGKVVGIRVRVAGLDLSGTKEELAIHLRPVVPFRL